MPTERLSAEGIIGIIPVNISLHYGNHTDGTDHLIVEAPQGVIFRTQKVPVEGRAGSFYLYIIADGGQGNTRNDIAGDVYGDVTQMGNGRGNTHNSLAGSVYGSVVQTGGTIGGICLRIPPHRSLWVWDAGIGNWAPAR